MIVCSVVVLTHNHLDQTRQFYKSLVDNCLVTVELIFVDDRSTDGTRDWITTLKPEGNIESIKLIKKETKRCFAQSCNLGIESATTEEVMVCNNDILFVKGSILNTLILKKRSNTDLMVPTTNNVGLQAQWFPGPMCCKKAATINKEVCFVAFMLSKDMWRKVKLDEHYEFGVEDIDYCWEVAKHRGKTGICLSSFVHHNHEGSNTVNAKSEGSKESYNKLFGNGWKYFAKKWGEAGVKRAKEFI